MRGARLREAILEKVAMAQCLRSESSRPLVARAKAGAHVSFHIRCHRKYGETWIAAFAGMTTEKLADLRMARRETKCPMCGY